MQLDEISVDLPSEEQNDKAQKRQNILDTLGLSERFVQHLRRSGFNKLTNVQEQALPILMQEQDSIIVSRTGSGKTLAFLIPLIHRLGEHAPIAGVRAVILSPTRELAIQTAGVLKKLTRYQEKPLRVVLSTGGDSLEAQFQALALNPDVIVATPGRLQFHIDQIKELRTQLKTVQYCVVDECDQMFEQQLLPQVQDLMGYFTRPQVVLCSATLPKQLGDFSAAKMKNPRLIQNQTETFPDELFIQNVLANQAFKEAALLQILEEIKGEKTMVFVATKYHCEYFVELFKSLGIACEAIYGALDQGTRNILVSRFQQNQFSVLFATDVAARGVDIPDLKYVINFNFPFNPRMFLHRGGRCARNGAYGVYINLVDFSELPYLIDANIYVGMTLQAINLQNYLLFSQVPIELEFAEDFEGTAKKQIKKHFAELFAQLTPEEQLSRKDATEAECKALLKGIAGKTYTDYQQFLTIRTYMRNTEKLKLPLYSYASLFNGPATQSRLNNQIGRVPQSLLDFKAQRIQASPVASSYNSTRNSMQNSLQQLNKQKKSASDASAERAKALHKQLQEEKHYLINHFTHARFEGLPDAQATRQLEVLESFKQSTDQIRLKAEAGSKEFQAMLKVREAMESRALLKKQTELFRQSLAPQIQTVGKHNDPAVLERIDKELKEAQQQQKELYTQSIVASKPQQREVASALNIEIQKDELANVKGQVQRKVWDPVRRRYKVVDPNDTPKHTKTEKKVQNAKGDWVTVQEKSLYEKWTKKSHTRVGVAGTADVVEDKRALQELRGQGLGRVQKRIMDQRSGSQNSNAQRTNSADKYKLEQQLNRAKAPKKQETKSQILQKKAEAAKEKGLDWKDVKRRQREHNTRSRNDMHYKQSRPSSRPASRPGKPTKGGKK